MTKLFTTHSERETLRFAQKFGRTLRPGTVVALTGEIGSGKTQFIKGLAQGLGVRRPREVKSPTFVLLHTYEARRRAKPFLIYHFDLYRLERDEELETIGFEEFLSDPQAVCLVEWAERASGRLRPDAIWVQLKIVGPTSRQIKIWGQVWTLDKFR